jgi:YVTN family beta-propeller protein
LACVALTLSVAAVLSACSQESRPTTQGPLLYVTNEQAGSLSVVDTKDGEIVATLPLGKRPRGLTLSPDGSRLLVALSGSPIAGPGVDEKTLPAADKRADGIGVVDSMTLRLFDMLSSGSDPEVVAVGSKRIWPRHQ